MAEWRWQEHVSTVQYAAVVGCVLSGIILVLGGVYDGLLHSMDEEQVATADTAGGLQLPFDVEGGRYAFFWQTGAPPSAANLRWNVSVSLETAGGAPLVDGWAAWDEHISCVADGHGGSTCNGPDRFRLMELPLDPGSYLLRVVVREANSSVPGQTLTASVSVVRLLPPPALDLALMVAGVAAGVAWVTPLAWSVRRAKARFLLEDAALGSPATPTVVKPRG